MVKIKPKKESITDIYLDYKEKYQKIYGKKCVVLLESGHFMEMYDHVEDSDHFDVCRDIMNILVTRRDKDPESTQYRQYMAGIPTHSIKRYYKTLLKHNYTVIVVEQVTPAPNPERAVTKILSPGASLSEDIHNDSETGNSVMFSILIEIDEDNDIYIDLCSFDTNLGTSEIQTIIDQENGDKMSLLKENLDMENYNEILITIINENKNIEKDIYIEEIINKLKIKNKMYHIKYFEDKIKSPIYEYFKISYQTAFLEEIFSKYKTIYTNIQENLDLNKQVSTTIANYIILLNFISLHDSSLIKNLPKPNVINSINSQYLKSFNETYIKLNIFENYGNSKNSLFKYINNTSCKSSKRLLIERLKKPLINSEEINRRYDFIEEMLTNTDNIPTIEKYLNIHDLQRIYRRFSISRLNPYEIPRLEFSNNQIIKLIQNIQNSNYNKIKKELLPDEQIISHFKKYCQEIEKIFDMEKCSKTNLKTISDTLFNKFIFQDIDGIVEKIENNKNILQTICRQLGYFVTINDEKKKYNIKELNTGLENNDKFINYVSLKSNDKEGYWLDITKTRGKKIKDSLQNENYPELIVKINGEEYKFKTKEIDWNTKNKTNMKLFSKQVKEFSNKINLLQEKLIKVSREKYLIEIERLYNKYYTSINIITDFVTNIDIIKSNAKTAHIYKYTRPKIIENKNSFINVEEIRHPIIERIINMNGDKYIPNSINIDENNSYLIYGVNSVGKSSFLKSLAISIIMAQSGFFVPAKKMEFSIYKKIFSRMGNNDDLFQNHSSFVKEMIESKEIIKKCDSNSFIIADELCSSTEIDSAVKIVSTILKILSEKKSSFVFATHIFKLSEINLIKTLKNIHFKHLKVRFENQLIFDRILTDGLPENKQYGSIVAEKIIQDDLFQNIMNNNSNFSENENIESKQIVNKQFSNYNNKLVLDKCQVCYYKPENKNDIPLETHHINMQCETDIQGYHGIYHKNELHNLVSLCKECHQKVHNDDLIIDGYIYTENGKKLSYKENSKNVSIIKSKKKKKKYNEKMILDIKEYYQKNIYKTKSIILKELREKYNIKSLSNPVFNKIIENKY